MHSFLFICIEAILMGAPYAYPNLPHALGQLMFWAGVAGFIGYPLWCARGWVRSHLEPMHIIALGLAIALIGVGWQLFFPKASAPVVAATEQNSQQELSITSDRAILSQPPSFLNKARFYSQAEREQIADAMNLVERLLSDDGLFIAREASTIAQQAGKANWDQLEKLIEKMNGVFDRAKALDTELDKIRNNDRLGIINLLAEKPVAFDPYKNAIGEMANTMSVYRHLGPNAGDHGDQLRQVLDSQKRNLLRAKHRFEEWMQKCDRLISGTRVALKQQ